MGVVVLLLRSQDATSGNRCAASLSPCPRFLTGLRPVRVDQTQLSLPLIIRLIHDLSSSTSPLTLPVSSGMALAPP